MKLLPAISSGQPIINHIHNIDALALLQSLPDACIDCCVTSPPYFGLRDYGVDGQIGLEKTPTEYVQTLVTLFREVRRVLKDSGTFWLNLGDSYNGSGKGWTGYNGIGNQQKRQGFKSSLLMVDDIAPKNLLLIPHRVAIALQDDGWIVRQDNVWHKPNPMPESVTDRTTRAHEYVFQFAKSSRYFFNADAIKEPAVNGDPYSPRGSKGVTTGLNSGLRKQDDLGKRTYTGFNERWDTRLEPLTTRNKRSVWTIPPAQSRDAHFATFPLELPEICIKAGCPVGGLVLDPFMGSGTTALVARSLGRNYIGSELNAEYVEIARTRLSIPYTPNMFIEVSA